MRVPLIFVQKNGNNTLYKRYDIGYVSAQLKVCAFAKINGICLSEPPERIDI